MSWGFEGATAAECVTAAADAGDQGDRLLDEIASRLALGVASVCVVLDPGLIVLAGEVGLAGGVSLTGRVEQARGPHLPDQAAGRHLRGERQPGPARRGDRRPRPGPRGDLRALSARAAPGAGPSARSGGESCAALAVPV